MQPRRFLWNASANLVRVFGSAIVGLIVPPILIRALPPAAYNTWLLVVQLSAYVLYLEIGIQSAIGRFIAAALERQRNDDQNRVISSALVLMTALAGLGVIGVLVLAWLLPVLFTDMPAALRSDAQLALTVVGFSIAVSLPGSVFAGAYIGAQRYGTPAAINTIGKVMSAALVGVAAWTLGSLHAMAWAVGSMNLATAGLLWWFWHQTTTWASVGLRWVSWATIRMLAAHCASLMVWMVSGLFISGMDLTIVGIWDFDAVAYYAVASLAVNFLVQIQNSVVTVIMPAAATLHARQASDEMGRLLITSTRYSMLGLVVASVPMFVGAHLLLQLWVGARFAEHATLLLRTLLVANVVRLMMLPYVTMLVGVGEHGKVWLSPVLGALLNCGVSVVATMKWGAVGAAFGTVVGGTFETSLHVFYNLARTESIRVRRSELVMNGLLRPLMTLSPFIPILIFTELHHPAPAGWLIGLTLIVGATAALAWVWFMCLTPAEQHTAIRFVGSTRKALSNRHDRGLIQR